MLFCSKPDEAKPKLDLLRLTGDLASKEPIKFDSVIIFS